MNECHEPNKDINYSFCTKLYLGKDIFRKRQDYPYKIFYSKEQILKVFNDTDQPYYPYSKLIELNNLNFGQYDYLVSRCRGIKKLYYSKELATVKDDCGYEKRLPAFADFKNDTDSLDYLAIYSLKEKGKYRSPCP